MLLPQLHFAGKKLTAADLAGMLRLEDNFLYKTHLRAKTHWKVQISIQDYRASTTRNLITKVLIMSLIFICKHSKHMDTKIYMSRIMVALSKAII